MCKIQIEVRSTRMACFYNFDLLRVPVIFTVSHTRSKKTKNKRILSTYSSNNNKTFQHICIQPNPLNSSAYVRIQSNSTASAFDRIRIRPHPHYTAADLPDSIQFDSISTKFDRIQSLSNQLATNSIGFILTKSIEFACI